MKVTKTLKKTCAFKQQHFEVEYFTL